MCLGRQCALVGQRAAAHQLKLPARAVRQCRVASHVGKNRTFSERARPFSARGPSKEKSAGPQKPRPLLSQCPASASLSSLSSPRSPRSPRHTLQTPTPSQSTPPTNPYTTSPPTPPVPSRPPSTRPLSPRGAHSPRSPRSPRRIRPSVAPHDALHAASHAAT